MRVRCPHCRIHIEDQGASTLRDIVCSGCGSTFSLIADADETDGTAAKQIGHFALMEKLGAGAFGTVWKARDAKLDRLVAIKVPRKGQLSESETEQFLREARAAAQLRHANIVGVHEIGMDQDSVYIVADYIEGVSLRESLNGQPLPPREAAELTTTIAVALEHAHEQGVVHRDLKPGNVMLDLDGQPHVLDFGLAKRESGEVTMTLDGAILGTPAYMSPEQARGESHNADRRSDIYSLGVMLFEMLTGELPFRGQKRMLIAQILSEDPPRPRKLNGHVPRDLETICLKCLEKNMKDRYLRAQHLASDLQRYLRGDSIHARPRSFARALLHWSRKPERTTEAAMVVLVISAFYGVWCIAGASMLYFGWVSVSDPSSASLIVALDFFGFAACLPIGLGMLRRNRWLTYAGVPVGIVMIIVVSVLAWTQNDIGGLLADSFVRLSLYQIFGFVGIIMLGASVVAAISCNAFIRSDSILKPTATVLGSTRKQDDCATTIEV